MKKITPTSYARAFIEVLDKNPKQSEKVLAELLQLIKKQGDWSRRQKIAEACERAWRVKNDRPLILLESARALGEKERASLKQQFSETHDFKEVVRPELLAGVRISEGGVREIDGSLARIMREMFASTT